MGISSRIVRSSLSAFLAFNAISIAADSARAQATPQEAGAEPIVPRLDPNAPAPQGQRDPEANVYLRINRHMPIFDINGDRQAEEFGLATRQSVIALPERFVVRDSQNRVNLRATLDNWIQRSDRGPGRIGYFRTTRNQGAYFFPVEVVQPGPTVPGTTGPNSRPERRFSTCRSTAEAPPESGDTRATVECAERTYLSLRDLLREPNTYDLVTRNPDNSWTTVPEAAPPPAPRSGLSVDGSPRGMQATGICPGGCGNPPAGRSSLSTDLAEIARRATTPPTGPMTPLAQSAINAPPAAINRGGPGIVNGCQRFMTSDGRPGPWGQSMIRIMAEDRYKTQFTDRNGLGNFCPNFNRLSDEQKLQAWAWFWTVLGNEEAKRTGCDLHTTHPTHGRRRDGTEFRINWTVGIGPFALERDDNIREWRNNRNGRRSGYRPCHDLTTIEGQSRCAIDTMVMDQLARGRTAQNSRYWGPTQGDRANRQIMPNMRRFSACF